MQEATRVVRGRSYDHAAVLIAWAQRSSLGSVYVKLKSLTLFLLTLANITSFHKDRQPSFQTNIKLEDSWVYLSQL